MCFFIDDDDSVDGTGTGSNSGSPKLQMKNHKTWLIPRKILMVILALAIIFIVLGLILMAIGGGIGSSGLKATGGVIFGLGIIGFIICLIVCLYAYFYYGTKNQEVQTEMQWNDEYLSETPGYASIGRPSALKSADSTLRRNGTLGQKKVTMAPELGPYGTANAAQGQRVVVGGRPQMDRSPGYGSNNVFFGDGSDVRGAGGRTVAVGSEVGTGGIVIVPQDRPFPSPGGNEVMYGTGQRQAYSGAGGSQVAYGGGQGNVVYSGGGGGSSAGSSMDLYSYPKNVSVISGPESGFSESASGSQYSTLRSIPVTHIVSEAQRQQQQRQQQQEHVEYARVNKQAKNMSSATISVPSQQGYVVQEHGQGRIQGGGQMVGGQMTQSQLQQRFPTTEDFDYDNPVERTPMIPPKQGQNYSYHEQQMNFQRQRSNQSDLHAPRVINTHSLQRQTGPNPYHQQQLQQQQQNQQQAYHESSYSTSSRKESSDDLPEPQPLVYPSARRPMTFEQVSSSKMSVYDNVLAGMKNIDDEEE